MLRTTIWHPDTCECVLEFQWDDAVEESQRVHSVTKIVAACPAHLNIPDKADHFNNVLQENTGKNKALGVLLEHLSSHVETVSDNEGNPVKQFKRGFAPSWSFDQARRLKVLFPSVAKLNPAVIASAKALIAQNKDINLSVDIG